ncbi:MAG: C-GCAxxG-C-C family (seleno)protein [Spirochaetia bacterium]
MLLSLLEKGFARGKDLNCAETILYGANEAYKLGLDKDSLKLSSGFGGGMGIEDTCGAVAGSVMVLGRIFVKDRAHESGKLKQITAEFLNAYRQEMGSINCAPLKEKYRDDLRGCEDVIFKAAEILDQVIEEYQDHPV